MISTKSMSNNNKDMLDVEVVYYFWYDSIDQNIYSRLLSDIFVGAVVVAEIKRMKKDY